jgi:uncharacterized membrane protein YeaQ/YmgE (transglycosylase-associated protein family)
MNIFIWLVAGALIGWCASMLMHTNGEQGAFLNVVVGICGALLGGWFFSPLLGVATINQRDFSPGSLLVSLLGAILLVGGVNMLRFGKPR